MLNVPYRIPFQTLNSNSAASVKYLISPNYYIQIKKTNWYYINVYTTIKGYLGGAFEKFPLESHKTMDCLRESYFKPKTVFWGGGSMQTKSSLTVFDIKCLPYVLQLRDT
jgi:hypothetical protein